MPRKPEDIKPLVAVKHEFYKSLDRFTHEAGMLADAVDQALKFDAIAMPAVADLLKRQLASFNRARFGDD